MNTSTCDKCGKEVAHGQYPFCPHDAVSRFNMIDDVLTGGPRWMHNLGDSPVWVESKSDLNRIMKERGLIHAECNNYSKDDKSPYATRTRLRVGQRDPFLQRA